MKRLFLGFLLLSGLALVFVLALAGYVKLTQPHSDADAPLQVTVQDDIVWSWEDTRLLVSFQPPKPDTLELPPMDVVVMLDTSSSMSETDLAMAKQAVITFLQNLGTDRREVRVGVIQFASQDKIVTALSPDLPGVVASIKTMGRDAGGGTIFLPPLTTALSVLRGSTNGKAIMLTDGAAGENSTILRSFYEEQWRPSGHELFLLGIGEAVDEGKLIQLTDDPVRYVITSLDKSLPGAVFNDVARSLGNFLGSDGRLALPLAEPLATWSESENAANPVPAHYNRLPLSEAPRATHSISPLFVRGYHWAAGITPKIGGILPLLHAPVTFDYLDPHGKRQTVRSHDASPRILAITPFFLFLLFLPAILYALAHILAWLIRPRAVIPELPMAPLRKAPSPRLPPLRRHVVDNARRVQWSPTLLIGIGRSGRHVLTHARQAIRDTRDIPASRPVMLALDVARTEIIGSAAEQAPACLDQLPEDDVFCLPESACHLQDRISERMAQDDPAAELDLGPYRNLGADALSLRRGTAGQAALARLALLNDLAHGADSALLTRLETALTAWRDVNPEVKERQIILVANAEGGLGQGWITDILILLRKLVAGDEARGYAVEILLLLLGAPESYASETISLGADKTGSLFDEINRLASAGRLPFPYTLSRTRDGTKDLLNGVVDYRPQDNILVMAGERSQWESGLFPSAAEALLLFMDQERRIELTHILEGLKQEENHRRAREGAEFYTEIKLRGIAFPHTLFEHLIALRLAQLTITDILCPGLKPGDDRTLPAIGQEKPAFPDTAMSTEDSENKQQPSTRDILVSMARGIPTSHFLPDDHDTLREASYQFLLLIQATWGMHLGKGDWNLDTLYRQARGTAAHLRAATESVNESVSLMLSDLAGALEGVSDQAIRWTRLLLGSEATTPITNVTDEANVSGLLKITAEDYQKTRDRLKEWSQNSGKSAVSDILQYQQGQASEDALFQQWLISWLLDGNPNESENNLLPAAIAQLRERCQWEITPGPDGKSLGLGLGFAGVDRSLFSPSSEGITAFVEMLANQVRLSLHLVTNTQVLSTIARHIQAHDKTTIVEVAEALKGDMRGDRTTLLISMPGSSVADTPETDNLRKQLQTTLTDRAGAAEIIRFQASRDSGRLLALNLMPLRMARSDPYATARSDPYAIERLPTHGYERRRVEYGIRMGKAFSSLPFDLPQAAGHALADEKKLTEFAALWAAGKVYRDEVTNLFQLRTDGRRHALTIFPEEGLADAAARFVANGFGAVSDEPLIPVVDCEQARDEDPFATLLCWLLSEKKGR
uniref:von Willebrand factor type A domain-containing protein n=1 Tax=Candidatus Kentrum sp. MB TaxID=2138164 RepID=A0A451BAX4_9GAMM|nr:MAG: von Willebrand factor type A domain-containing protein [Candidatus Kentron sp. MB]VFK75428.1 MAG: von Willebrand factor type A domain-containing protein [Candidatus Kentron sp. MB]